MQQQLHSSHLTQGDQHVIPVLPFHVSQSEIRISQRWREEQYGREHSNPESRHTVILQGQKVTAHWTGAALNSSWITMWLPLTVAWHCLPSVQALFKHSGWLAWKNTFPPSGSENNESEYLDQISNSCCCQQCIMKWNTYINMSVTVYYSACLAQVALCILNIFFLY